MSKVPLTIEQQKNIKPGEAITLATILAIMAIGIITVVVYKLFLSSEGSLSLPGGYEFSWK